ncbi:MAG: valine--tRNA ligase [Myxococcota bacterium]
MSFDHRTEEPSLQRLWSDHDVYAFDPHGEGPVFAVDTPPPYVSAAHLHVGHAMSYTQAEIVVRWRRMRGERVYYPMGFDDNGLPTERYVEAAHKIDKSTIRRSEFRALCLAETQRGAAIYETLWRSLGLSVDWSLRYSTIDAHSRRTAQRSFVELAQQGHIVRDEAPVMWDPVAQCALAQADVITMSRRQKLHRIRFTTPEGQGYDIATTRPELLFACVALHRHPDDPRYAELTEACVPLSDRRVPVLLDQAVDRDLGTGLLMTSTFGDAEDVRRWRRDELPLRLAIGPDGRMTELARDLAGRTVDEARAGVVRKLTAAGLSDGFTMLPQQVPRAERTDAAVEWQVVPQWSLQLLGHEDRFRNAAARLRWFPAHMKARLDHWIDGLAWNWSLSRQRFYGVPIPAWFCTDCGTPMLARIEDLPIDPLEDAPPCEACPECGGALTGDPDVLDTWMTSSMTPQIHTNWAQSEGRRSTELPLTVRVQAHEIIRTWLFYTLVKTTLHHGDEALPWQDVMISGWGLDEQGKKISKRNLAKSDADGFNRYNPAHLIERYGADALRHWAAKSQLGHDLRFAERDVKAGRRSVVKLWNAARLADQLGLPETPPPLGDRPPEDRDLLHHLDQVIATTNAGFEAYDYARGLAALDRFFFGRFCDDWLETIKTRVYQADRFAPGSAASAQATCDEALRTILALYAPYLPFVTDSIWQRRYREREGGLTLHTTRFPMPAGHPEVPEMAAVWAVLRAVRTARTQARFPQSRPLARLVVEAPRPLGDLHPTLLAATRAERLEEGPAEHPVEGTQWRITVTLE